MAYDKDFPADDSYLADFPSGEREQIRAIVEDKIVNAGKLLGLAPSNSSGQVPVSNGTVCVNLNADKLDGYDASHFSADGHVHNNASTSTAGFMSAADKTKLDGVATGAEVNQNAFGNVAVGTSTLQADNKQDTLYISAGNNIRITADEANDKITIGVSDLDTTPTVDSTKLVTSGGIKSAIDTAISSSQADWNVTDSTKGSYIKNKPDIYAVKTFSSSDNQGYPKYLLLYDITNFTSGGLGATGFQGVITLTRSGGYQSQNLTGLLDVSIQFGGTLSEDTGEDVLHLNSSNPYDVLPVVLKNKDKYYLALRLNYSAYYLRFNGYWSGGTPLLTEVLFTSNTPPDGYEEIKKGKALPFYASHAQYSDTAAKLATARTLSLSGTGLSATAQSFDGSGNVTIPITLAGALLAIAGITPSAGKIPVFTGANTASLASITDFMKTLLGKASANDVRSAIGAVDVSGAGVVAGNVSNEKAWWVKLGGTIPLIIQGGYTWVGIRTDVNIAFPISLSHVLGIAGLAVVNSQNSSGRGLEHIKSFSAQSFTYYSGYDIDNKCLTWMAFGL